MNNLILNSNTNISIGDKPMVLLPLDIYEKIAKNLDILKIKKYPKGKKTSFLTMASESSLSKDWLRPEEEKVWQNL